MRRMWVALILAAASCAEGVPERAHHDVIAERPKKPVGCWAKLNKLAAKGWPAARAQLAHADKSACMNEVRATFEKFKDQGELLAWLKEQDLLDGVPPNVPVLSVRH